MKRNYNSTAFTPEEVEKGLHLKLIKHLLEESSMLDDSYNDIHIWSDGYCTIIDWAQVSYNHDYEDGKFCFVDYDQVVMFEKKFPDNSTSYFFSEDEYQEELKKWLEENPGWEKSEYGRWYNKIEEERLREYLNDKGLKRDESNEK